MVEHQWFKYMYVGKLGKLGSPAKNISENLKYFQLIFVTVLGFLQPLGCMCILLGLRLNSRIQLVIVRTEQFNL